MSAALHVLQDDVDDVTRALPHAVGPEKSVLSSMLQDPQDFIGRAVEEGLTAGHFYLPSHAALFRILTARFDENLPIEFVSLTQELLDKGMLASVGGPAALTDIYTYTTSSGYFLHHLKLVKDKFVLRSVIQNANAAIAQAHDSPEAVEELLDNVEQGVMAIREGRESIAVESTKDAVEWVMEDFRQRVEGKTEVAGMQTGFSDLDLMTGGLKGGDMFVIAARPSMGKTAIMMNIVEHHALDSEGSAMVFSCEMTRRQLVQRMTYSRAKFASQSLSRGYSPTKGDLQRIQRAAIDIARANLLIDDTPGITISQLRAKARRRKREKGLSLIAVDYLQLMKSFTKQALNSREREIAEISAGLKGLAKELDVPVIVLAQLNRGPEGRGGKGARVGVPRMSDLRESGSIEQDADMVGLLYRTAYYADGEDKEAAAGEAQLILAKNRNGSTGDINLTFVAGIARFENGRPYQDPEPAPAVERKGWTR